MANFLTRYYARRIIKIALKRSFIGKRNAIILFNIIKYKRLTCELCGKPLGKRSRKTLDHRVPKCRGGSNDFDNLQLAHYGCNHAKADKRR